MLRSRRHFVQMAAASVLAIAVPIAPAQAQWLEPVLKALQAIGAALNIAAILAPWLHDLAADKRCKVTIDDLENIKIDCDILSQTIDDQVIPLLSSFVINKDNRNWKKVKISVATLLADGIVLMGNINKVLAQFDETTYPASKDDIEKLYHGIDDIRATMVILGRLPDNPDPVDYKLAGEVLSAISSFPEMAKVAVEKLQIAIDERQKLKCP
jgi:hypothetical protein